MSGFVASPVPPVSAPGTMVGAGPFWPSIALNDARDVMRTGDQSVADARVREGLVHGIIEAGDMLDAWRATQEALGHPSLAAVPAEQIDGTSRNVLLFRRAVLAYAAAWLIETHRDVSATASGVARADQQATTPDALRREAIHACRAIMGRPRTFVSLV